MYSIKTNRVLRTIKTKFSLIHVPTPIEYVKPGVITPIIRAPLLNIDYNDLTKLMEKDEIESVEITRNDKHVSVLTTDNQTLNLDIPTERSLDFMNKLQNHDVSIYYKEGFNWANVPMFMFQGMIFLAIIGMVFQMVNQRKNINDFTQSQAQEINEIDVKFDDVAGLKNAKQDLQEIVDFLKNPERFNKLGAKVPKGALLVGAPGCGKTLLAKAVAGEAGVPFFSCSASEMVQMFVGVGAARVRSLFEKANKRAPAIIFIDEIDAIARARTGLNSLGSNDEREQTINQLLTEMDGFKTNTGVIVLAATNRVDVLDPAILRPGRFDRQIQVELPDFKDRIEILKVHTRNKPLIENFNVESIAKMTIGFSGADLANLANEAAIWAARNQKDDISEEDFHSALDKITLGERRDIIVSEQKKLITAYHEAGHALVALITGLYDNIRTVSIVPRGKTGGVTIFEPKEDDVDSGLLTKEYLEKQLAVALGGRVAEEIVFGSEQITTGASADITMVQNIARHMVTHYGFSDSLGPIAWHSSVFSEATQMEIDFEIKMIVLNVYTKTKDLLNQNRYILDKIANELMTHEILSGKELKEIIEN